MIRHYWITAVFAVAALLHCLNPESWMVYLWAPVAVLSSVLQDTYHRWWMDRRWPDVDI